MTGLALITLQRLQAMCETAQGKGRCAVFLPYLIQFCADYDLTTPVRLAAFFGQVLHESSEFRYVRELGSQAYLEKYDTGALAQQLGNTPVDDDDGQQYRGRGLIQITGRDNYQRCSKALGMDLLADPQLLEQPEFAVRSACWYWSYKGLNDFADAYDYRGITKRINGGFTGMDSRIRYWERARRAFGMA